MHDELIQKIHLLRSWYVVQDADTRFEGTGHPWFPLSTREIAQIETEIVPLICDELLKRLEGEKNEVTPAV